MTDLLDLRIVKNPKKYFQPMPTIKSKIFWNLFERLNSIFSFISENTDSCTPDPCQNGGTCMVDNGVATCICPPGKTGDNCAGMPTSDLASQNCPKILTNCHQPLTAHVHENIVIRFVELN